jgi:hypothetical protein
VAAPPGADDKRKHILVKKYPYIKPSFTEFYWCEKNELQTK